MKQMIVCLMVAWLSLCVVPAEQVSAEQEPAKPSKPNSKPATKPSAVKTKPKLKPRPPVKPTLTDPLSEPGEPPPVMTPTPKAPSPTPAPTPPVETTGSGLGNWPSIFLSAGAVIFSLLTFWRFGQRVSSLERRGVQNNLLARNLDEVFAQLDDLNRRLDEHARYAQAYQSSHADLQQQLLELNDDFHTLKRGAAASAPALSRHRDDIYERSAARSEARPKPAVATAAELLARSRSQGISVKAVVFRPETLQRAKEGEAVYLVAPDERRRGFYVVLPNVPRFSSSQDYSYFTHFYDCDQPASGEILIAEPALASYDDHRDEWTLSKKGRLQIG
jgi:hypothetical protein